MRLNIGSGSYPLDGFINLDLPDFDMTVIPWVYSDNSADFINLSHVIEHVDRDTGALVIAECYRVLSYDGILRIATPDLDKFIHAHATGDFSGLGGYHWTSLNSLAGGGDDEPVLAQRHRYLYSAASLIYTLLERDYTIIHRTPFDERYDNPKYQAISLYMEATK